MAAVPVPWWAFCPAAVRAARAAATPFSFRLFPDPVEPLASGPSASPKACRPIDTGEPGGEEGTLVGGA